jgi:hypothetical protein
LGASVINCCHAARGIGVSSTTTKTVDCPNLTLSENQRSIANGKISLNVSPRVVSPQMSARVSRTAEDVELMADSEDLSLECEARSEGDEEG